MTRDLDQALFLLGESTLTAAEVLEWATELGYPATAEATHVGLGTQLTVVRSVEAEAVGLSNWRGKP